MIHFDGGTFEVDAATIADGLGIDSSSLRQRMREGRVTTSPETIVRSLLPIRLLLPTTGGHHLRWRLRQFVARS